MATSGTYAFQAPVDDILVEAWQRIGLNPATLTGEHAVSARRSLQLVLIDWGNRGAQLWQIEQVALTTTAGSSQVALPARVMDVLDLYVTVDKLDLLLASIGRNDYAGQTNKGITGRPTQMWVDRQIPAPVLNLFPTPDRAYPLTGYVLRQPQDVSGMLQTIDAPVMWADALAAALALRLARKYKQELVADLRLDADQAYANASGESRERVPLSIMPDFNF